jgi:arginyl-tRNA synthetase
MNKDSFLGLKELLTENVRAASQEAFQIILEDVNAEVPPRAALGDLAFPVAFELAKRIKQASGEKKAPRLIAEELRNKLVSVPGISRVEVAGAGYLNVFFDRPQLLLSLSAPESAESVSPTAPKRMVEHTSINPNKAAHIGHVRNAVLGDTFVRILAASGERVEVQNYIDNTGVQVADVVVGFMHIEKMTLDDIKNLDRNLPSDRPFDYYCWDLYTRVGLFYRNGTPNAEPDPERLKLRQETLHAIEEGGNTTAELADYVATRNVEQILHTMERLGIRYDVLPRESEILHLKFWDHAFERMKEIGAIRLETEGRNKGCWVMPFESHTGTDEHEADKIIVRSNGTVTYTGKDIAYQLWKLGKLGLDFHYRLFREYSDGHLTWMTSSHPITTNEVEIGTALQFGSGATVYNVIDSRQSYTQEIVKRGVAAIAPEVGQQASVHLSYEMVALTAKACEELGIPLSEDDRARPFIEMSGRKGLGVKADDLIGRLEADALAEVNQRHPDLSDSERADAAHAIAVGALRYFLLKFTRNSVIAFDFQEALSFEGETGPYCQYAAVRANSIFRKAGEGAVDAARSSLLDAVGDTARVQQLNELLDGETGDEIWSLVALAARLDENLHAAKTTAEPAHIAKYTFSLAKAFNLFYHRHRILAEENALKRALLILVADFARKQLTRSLEVLGISVPERM